MEIQEQKLGAVFVLRPVGAIATGDAEQIKTAALRTASKNLGRVLLDISRVPFVDSQCIEAFLDVTEQLGQSGQVLKLCGVNDTIKQALDLTGNGDVFEYFDDVNQGVRSFL